MKREVIPIVLLHYDQPDVLLKSVELIYLRTSHPYQLFVVDNCSPPSELLSSTFLQLAQKYQVQVLHNPKNNWIYGFNLAINHHIWPVSSLYAFSDADIFIPESVNGKCWLTYLAEQMNSHCSIGKLGLPLSVENLKRNPQLKDSLALQESYSSGYTIGENIVAPVDTTMALYRSDFFVTGFKFQIGHGSLAKPQYYTCRASKKVEAIHAGWDYYPNGDRPYSTEKQWKKSVVMAKLGAYIAPELLNQFSVIGRLYLHTLRSSVRILHSVKVSWLIFIYLVRRFPRRINEIQSSHR